MRTLDGWRSRLEQQREYGENSIVSKRDSSELRQTNLRCQSPTQALQIEEYKPTQNGCIIEKDTRIKVPTEFGYQVRWLPVHGHSSSTQKLKKCDYIAHVVGIIWRHKTVWVGWRIFTPNQGRNCGRKRGHGDFNESVFQSPTIRSMSPNVAGGDKLISGAAGMPIMRQPMQIIQVSR